MVTTRVLELTVLCIDLYPLRLVVMLEWVVVMVSLVSHFSEVKNHLRGTLLEVSEKEIPARLNWGVKTSSECGCQYS